MEIVGGRNYFDTVAVHMEVHSHVADEEPFGKK